MSISVAPRPAVNAGAIVVKFPFSSKFVSERKRPSGILEELLPELIQSESKWPKGWTVVTAGICYSEPHR